jgi:DNA polymerase-1
MSLFPDLSAERTLFIDTETTGVDSRSRPVGCSVSTVDERSWYFSWGAGDPNGLRGPAEMNNCSLPEFVAWANRELRGKRIAGHYLLFDMRMLAYVGVMVGDLARSLECTSTLATLTNEHRPSFSLDNLARAHGLGAKADGPLHEWMVRHLQQFKLAPTRKSCAPHYWRVPVSVMAEYARFDPVLTGRYLASAWPELAKESVERVYRLECAILPCLVRMHLSGVRISRERAGQVHGDLARRLRAMESEWHDVTGGREINPNSGDQLGPLFDELGIAYPRTPKSKKPSITVEVLEASDHPVADLVRRIRKTTYYSKTSIDGAILGSLADGEDVIHGEFHPLRGDQYGTITGRFSSGGELNLQNQPARDEEWAPLIRSLFVPMNPDQQWLKVDYSQIEYRFFAHYAGLRARILATQEGGGVGVSAMEQAYLKDPLVDFHQWVADTADIKRKRAKNVNFCRLYGGGIGKIAATAGCSIEEAKEFVGKYDAAVPEAKALMKDITGAAERRGFVTTWYGRRLRFMTEGQMAAKYNYQCEKAPGAFAKTYTGLNKVLQGSAADLIKLAMVEIGKAIDWDTAQMHLQVHDELDFSVPKGDVGIRIARDIVEIMESAGKTPMWNGQVMQVPVVAEPELGLNWGVPYETQPRIRNGEDSGRREAIKQQLRGQTL